jgi:hypothetical protein
MNLFLRPRSVLVLNNMNSYFSKNLTIIYKEAGVRLEYLFLYLFNYNPIEEFFSILKS